MALVSVAILIYMKVPKSLYVKRGIHVLKVMQFYTMKNKCRQINVVFLPYPRSDPNFNKKKLVVQSKQDVTGYVNGMRFAKYLCVT